MRQKTDRAALQRLPQPVQGLGRLAAFDREQAQPLVRQRAGRSQLLRLAKLGLRGRMAVTYWLASFSSWSIADKEVQKAFVNARSPDWPWRKRVVNSPKWALWEAIPPSIR